MVIPLTPDDPASLGAFRLAGRLGEGGQGVVYLAHGPDGEPVAVKLLSTGDAETRARLARELAALESVASFCTARVLDASTDGPRPYVVSEFVDGPSLTDRVRERGPLRGGDLERLVVGTATALAAIHAAGVVHRDFKPANVLLGPDGPRVVDFGIARAEGAATLTSGLIGTPAYLAPEQIGGSPASAASDVFGWAATMVFAATGRSPFGADTVPAVLHRVLHAEPDLSSLPPRLRDLIAASLAKDPSRRPSARDLMLTLVHPTPGGNGGAPIPAFASAPTGSSALAVPSPGAGSPAATGPRPAEGPGPPDTVPGSGHPAGTGGPPGRARGVLIGVLAVVVALAAGGAVLWFGRGSLLPSARTTAEPSTSASADPADQGASAASTAPVSPPTTGTGDPGSASPPASTAAKGSVRIPAAFAGTWKGTADGDVLGTKFDDEPVTITLRQGDTTGVWDSPGEDPGCAKGTLTTKDLSGPTLTFGLSGLGGTCAIIESAGGITVSLKRKDDGRADYELTMPLAGRSKGDLTRSGPASRP
ncbi:serine/threonine protein kinase [Nonomuraea cavernae]|uniref:serine/threonine protein kinase n=1 Tax=Nonomuraea cavernae TaxID=2045107 RepID=UPI0033CD0697